MKKVKIFKLKRKNIEFALFIKHERECKYLGWKATKSDAAFFGNIRAIFANGCIPKKNEIWKQQKNTQTS